jgi:hypothetical protein
MVDRFVVQTITHIEYTVLNDGTTKHKLIKAFSSIVGEPKEKKAKRIIDIDLEAAEEKYA